MAASMGRTPPCAINGHDHSTPNSPKRPITIARKYGDLRALLSFAEVGPAASYNHLQGFATDASQVISLERRQNVGLTANTNQNAFIEPSTPSLPPAVGRGFHRKPFITAA